MNVKFRVLKELKLKEFVGKGPQIVFLAAIAVLFPDNVGNVVDVVVVGHCCLTCSNKFHGCHKMFVVDKKDIK